MATATPTMDDDLYGDIYGEDIDAPLASTSSLPEPEPSLSYSAQIAQQFSNYQQTPSQERQERPRAQPIPTGCLDDTVFGKKPSEMHDAGKLFIGGLSWETTDEGLRDYFSKFGKVDACTIMRDASGTSKGFAFLTFEDPASVNAVVVCEHFLDGKAIDPKRAIPREEHLRTTRYFVGGLSPNTTADSMREFFSAYGKVVDTTVMFDRESSRSKGFGFVTFEDATNTDQLVGKGLILDDKQIEVKTAQPRNQREPSRSNRDQQNFGNQSIIPFIPQQPSHPLAPVFFQPMGMMPSIMQMNPILAATLGMGNSLPGGAMMGMNPVMNPVTLMRMGLGMQPRTMGQRLPVRTNRGQHSYHPYAR